VSLAFYLAPIEYTFQFHRISTPQPIIRNITTSVAPVKFLASRLNFWGLFDTIEYGDLQCFNPSILSLPSPGNGTRVNLLVVAREPVKSELREGTEVSLRVIRAGLLDIEGPESGTIPRTPPRHFPRKELHSQMQLDHLVYSEKNSIPECSMYLVDYHNVQGPEDGRLFWSSIGEPLMIYNSPSPINSDLCRILYLIDLRVVYPVLGEILSAANELAPIRFTESVPLLFPGQEGIHKNWAPFTDATGDIFIHVSLHPQTIYKLNISHPPHNFPTFSSPAADLVTLEPVSLQNAEEENCVTRALKDIGDSKIHQSSSFIEVIRCTSADVRSRSCDPHDPKNRLYIGVFHLVDKSNWPPYYEARVVTLNSSWPFNYVSISKPLIYSNALPLFNR
jgi:hypothetical protein